MAVDGSLIFDTKIDADGFNKGAKELSSKTIDLKNKISSTEAAIKNLKNELAKTGDVKVKTKVAEKLETDLAKAKQKLSDFYAEADRIGDAKQAELSGLGFDDEYLDKALEQDKAWQQIQDKISKAELQVERYEKALEQANNAAPLGKDTAEFQKKEQRLNELTGQLGVYKAKLHEAEQAEQTEADKTAAASRNTAVLKKHLQRTISALKMFGRGAAKAGSLLKSAFSKSAGKLIQSIGNRFKKTNNQTNVLEKSLKRIKNTLVRMFFFRLVHSPIDAIKDGLGEIAKISPTLNKNLSALKTESTYLKNSLAALAAPLVNLVTPAFVSFMQTISGVLNKTGQLIAVLTGQSGFTQAVKVQQDYADSLDESTKSTEKNTKATKENQKALAGFDELNVLDVSEEDSDDSSEAVSPMYEEVEAQVGGLAKTLLDALKKQDFDAIGKLFGDKINSALKKINWNKIKKTTKSWATKAADFLNGFVKGLDWSLVGSTIGNGINTALIFSLTFLTKFNWKKFGESLAKLINSAAKTINWKIVGKTIAAGLNALISEAHGFVSNLDWSGIGAAFHTAVKETLENVNWETLIDTLALGINGLVDLAIAFVGEPDFSELGSKTAKGLKDFIRKINWGEITKLFSTLLIGSLNFLNGFVLEVDWKDFGKKLSDSFNDFFGEGGDGRNLLKTIGETLGNFIVGTSDFIIEFFKDPKSADNFAGAIEECFKKIPWVKILIKSITGGIEIGTWIIQGVSKLVNDFCYALSNGFSDMKDDPELSAAVKALGKAIGNLFIGVINLMLGTLFTAIPNLFITLIKNILGAMSGILKFVLGDDFYNQAINSLDNWKGFNPKDAPQIPYLATGAYIPANYGEFLAVLGDNKREPEVVSPVSAMKQAVLEALAESRGGSGDQPQEINLYIDGDKFFTWLIGKNNRYQKSHGQSAFKEVRA